MPHETRIGLNPNDILDIELGKIHSKEAVRLLLDDLKTSEAHIDECLQAIEEMHDKKETALALLDELATEIENMIDEIAAEIEEGKKPTLRKLQKHSEPLLSLYSRAYTTLED